jgi:glutathione S-transferase
VLKAVQDSGMPFEQVKEPLRRGKRDAVQEHTGQRKLPALELDDGTWVRAESKDLITRIQAGEFAPPPAA